MGYKFKQPILDYRFSCFIYKINKVLVDLLSDDHNHKMKTKLILIMLVLVWGQSFSQKSSLLSYVQPLTGTSESTTKAAILKHGAGTEQLANTIPSVTLPFAMTQWTPQTRPTEQKCESPYYYKDKQLSGFRGTHWLSGGCTQDYGSVTIMPITGRLVTTLNQYQTSFSHQQEITSPAYYSVVLPQYSLQVEMSATKRCGILQVRVSKDDSLYILITPNSDYGQGMVKINKEGNEIVGFNPVHRIYQGWGQPAGFSGYFVVQIETVTGKNGVFHDSIISGNKSIMNKNNLGAFIGMKVKKGAIIRLRIGTSFSSIEGARKNLQSEIKDWNFDRIRRQGEASWLKALAQIKIETDHETDKKIFYTAFYHAMQHPRLFNDVDGTYPMFANNYKNAKLNKGSYYDDFSMWDIFRAQLPLWEICNPELVNSFVNSLIIKAHQGGWLPIFPLWNSYTQAMVGDHATAFISSAYVKGIRNYDVQEAYDIMRKNAFEIPDEKEYKNGKGRRALASYLKYGYIPLDDSVPDAFHTKEQVSRTLEYAYDDYSLAMVAKGLSKLDDYHQLIKRSENYKNVFDSKVGFVNGRYANGNWYQHFDADKKVALFKDGINFITEGTPRQYSFYVPQNIPGLQKLMGGVNAFEMALDSIFIKNEYWHGNEPGHQIPFMYNYTSHPYKTQQVVHNILTDEYDDGIGGLSGNDDAGQMSAWYVLASMGLYPVDPVDTMYAISAPIFNKISIKTGNNKTTIITCKKQSPSSFFIKSIRVNGKIYKQYFISHKVIINAAKIEFVLSDKPVIN